MPEVKFDRADPKGVAVYQADVLAAEGKRIVGVLEVAGAWYCYAHCAQCDEPYRVGFRCSSCVATEVRRKLSALRRACYAASAELERVVVQSED
jgi:hypothetical protein